jgi:hypothetical protein
MRCKHCGSIDSKPASWDALRAAILATDPKSVVAQAIFVQLEFAQPSGDVYAFLTRILDLSHNAPPRTDSFGDGAGCDNSTQENGE